MKRLTGISVISLSLLIGWFVLSAAENPSKKLIAAFPGKAIAAGRSEIIQFAAGGHMVEFRNDGIIMAAGDHALRIEFIGSTS